MNPIFITNDASTYRVEASHDDEGYASAVCTCGWVADPDVYDWLPDAVDEARRHVDGAHGGAE